MHFCQVSTLQDFYVCQQQNCYTNSIGCKQCFSFSHVSQNNSKKVVHQSISFIQSPLYFNLKRLVQLQQLLQKKVSKDLSSFKTNYNNMAMVGLCQSDLFKQIFDNDQNLINQFMFLKQVFMGNKMQFRSPPSDHLCMKLKTVTQAKISPYKKSMQDYTKEWEFINVQFGYLMGNHALRLENFIAYQQQYFTNYCQELGKNSKSLNIFEYFQFRRKQQKQSTQQAKYDAVYFTRQFEDFMTQKYRENPSQKTIFDVNQYINNFWSFFSYGIHGDPNIKPYFDYQLQSYNLYKQQVGTLGVDQSLLGFKVWKSVNRPSQILLHNLYNHYFYETFILALIDLKIQKYLNEKIDIKINSQDFSKYLHDFTEMCKNQIVDLSNYQGYFAFRQDTEKFIQHLKQSKEIVFNKKLAIEYLNSVFQNLTKPALKKYKQYLEENQNLEKNKFQKEKNIIESLREKCMKAEGQKFYEYVFNNFVVYARQKQRSLNQDQYYLYKKAVLQEYDQDYIKLEDQKAKQALQNLEKQAMQMQTIEQQGTINNKKKLANQDINEDEQRMAQGRQQDSQDQEDEIRMCLCCNGSPYDCQQEDCKMMGCCVTCMLG